MKKFIVVNHDIHDYVGIFDSIEEGEEYIVNEICFYKDDNFHNYFYENEPNLDEFFLYELNCYEIIEIKPKENYYDN